MPAPTNNSGLRDNHTRGTVADFLREKSLVGSQLSIVSAYFTIYAYDALQEELERIEHLDFLFGEPSFVNRLDPNKTEKKAFIIDADGLELSNKLQQKCVAKECADWIERKVDVKTFKQSNLLHGKMYHAATAGVEDATTSEAQMHTALQHNLWIFGNEYSLMASNRQLQTIVKDFSDRIYKAKDEADRPDLLLAANVEDRHLLVEFKRPALTIGRAAESQAVIYADTLSGQLGISLDILIFGGQVDTKLQSEYSGKRTKFLAYRSVISTARTQLEWLLWQLNEKP